ncbi:hypothetical protein [Paractinoplanes brasiliensis]|uniref:Uncharacterized protein n=1 Tax=Paractinoplanes brasiliensis TaxID=52695 RepID=A0A4R6JYF9_9ACTN|nr:hypothetical protein [Actinoplanes brasiliensis]TDO41779.1 hypothetical protein C8E87_5522 [Actinoplanes brasiliensis]GID29955.1 hypothetical protein Abr02nite_49380 [Actinoplanes brasiliensis]
MVYDDETGKLVHLGLPLPTMRELADAMAEPPSSEVTAAIIESARRRTRRLGRWKVHPYRLEAALRRSGVDVSVDQVAWVILTWLRVLR